jgi:predicted MFS family arabinose efflux permease
VGAGRRQFHRLWAGQTASVFGTAVSALALPSIAILGMHATAFQVGLLEAAQFAAYPLLGLTAGVLIDRWSRRRTMIVADVARGLALVSIPLAAWAHALGFAQLIVVAVIVGTGSVFFDVAYQAFVPSLVEADWLEHANARLEASNSVAGLVGAGLAGALIGAFGAPLAVVVDAVSYIVSILSLAGIHVREAHREPDALPPIAFGAALRDGLRLVFGSPVLRALLGATAGVNLGWAIVNAVVLLFYYRVLHFSPALVGAVVALGNIGFVGAITAPALGRRFRTGHILAFTVAAVIIATFLLPLAVVFQPLAVIVAMELIAAPCIPIYNVTQLSLRQRLVAPDQLGRMSATMKTVIWGVMPIGALIGGGLGSTIGIVPTIVAGAVVMLSALPWVFTPEIRALPARPLTQR